MSEALSRYVTAVSLRPLPPSADLREIVWDYLSRQRPADILRDLADALETAETVDDIPDRIAPTYEANQFLEDYRARVYRRTYRCSDRHAARLRAMARATGLSQTSIIRAALHDARQRQGQLGL